MPITAEELNIILQVKDKQLAKALKDNEKRVQRFSANTNRSLSETSRSFNRLGRSAGANRAALQNASFQLQDIITQISMGTSATRALSIQLPQLLGGLGALGAVVGVGVGALGMFAPALFEAGDAAESLEEQLKALDKAMNNLTAAESSLSLGVSGLRDQYGELSEEARELLAIQREIAFVSAMREMIATTEQLTSAFGVMGDYSAETFRDTGAALEGLTQRLAELRDGAEPITDTEGLDIQASINALGDLAESVTNLQDKFKLTSAEAGELAALFAELKEADGPREQAEIMLKLAAAISDAVSEMEDGTEEAETLRDQLLNAAEQMFKLASIDISTNIGKGADEAARLADNLALAARGRQMLNAAQNNPDFYDPRNESGLAGQTDPNRYDVPLGLPGVDMPANPTGASKGSKRRKRSGGGSRADQKSAMERLIEEVALNEQLLGLSEERQYVLRRLASEASEYSETEINGIIGRIAAYETEKDALKTIQELQQDVADTVEDSMTNAFMSIIDGTKSASDAFKDMARQIIAELLRVLVIQRMVGSFDSKTGKSSGIVGAIMGAFGGGKASGGVVQAGRPYMVGEHGPEPFIPSQGGRVLSVGQAKSALAGGGAGPTVTQYNTFTADVRQTVRAELKSFTPQLIAATKRAVGDEARRNPNYLPSR